VLHVAELARQYERIDGLSFRGFVEALREAAERGDATEAPIVEEGSDGVRLMTVHKAKGLEFPVVVLADPTAKLAQLEAGRFIDTAGGRCALRIGGWSPKDLLDHQALEHARDLAEGVRLAYVAATRARDLLVVPAVGDEPYDGGWVSPLNGAVYPAASRRRTPSEAPLCPAFKRDSVLERPDGDIASASTVSPGAHAIGDDPAHDVVWWDPAALHLDVEPPYGLRRQELIAKDVAPSVIEEGTLLYESWRQTRTAALASGALPWASVRTTTEWAAAPPANAASVIADPSVGVLAVSTADARPSGTRFGTLVHAALATLPLEADAPDLEALVSTHARIVGATPEEVQAAGEAVAKAWGHTVLDEARRAARGGWCHREVPVTLSTDDELIEGVVDLAFEIDGVVTVVDFKTDRPDPERLEQYVRQVSLYAEAVRRATGKPVRAILLQV
jgi:ATP-dependent exoDNAse (exonuclease V) beta subunit